MEGEEARERTVKDSIKRKSLIAGNLDVSLPFRNIVSIHLARYLRIYSLVIDRKERQTACATSVTRKRRRRGKTGACESRKKK